MVRFHQRLHKKFAVYSGGVLGTTLKLTTRKEVILSAGPVNTPHILMNSGVGDRDSLIKLGIQSVLHLPSVGKNFSDQPIVEVSYSVNSNDPLKE